MKPNWKDAPEWANYVAMNWNCCWFWYENKPYRSENQEWKSSGGKIQAAGITDWSATIDARPSTATPGREG